MTKTEIPEASDDFFVELIDRQVRRANEARQDGDTGLELHELDVLIDHTRARIVLTLKKAREQGYTWAQIGTALSITKQAAHERYGGL